MSDANFGLIFRRWTVDHGGTDFKDLAPSLMILGKRIQAVNAHMTTGSRGPISVLP